MFFLTPAFDLNLFLLINQHWRNGVFDFIMPIFSSMGVLLVILTAAVIFAYIKGGKRQLVLFLVLFAGMGLSDFSTNMIKKQINRVRPMNAIAETYYQEGDVWQQRPSDYVQTKEKGTSYPSAHSSTSMCLAVLLILLWPALKKWPLILPILVGYSRVYLGKHYPTDVLAGWAFGLILAALLWLIWDNFGKKYLPEKKD